MRVILSAGSVAKIFNKHAANAGSVRLPHLPSSTVLLRRKFSLRCGVVAGVVVVVVVVVVA